MTSRAPSREAIASAAAAAGPEATILQTIVLAGGTHADTFLIRTTGPGCEFVLREFPPGDHAAERETGVLSALHGLHGLAPRLLASNPGRGSGDRPWTLITRLQGQADIASADPAAHAVQLGEVLARIHATPLNQLAGFRHVFDWPGGTRADLSGPAAPAVRAAWADFTLAPSVLTHYDYWSGNTLWQNGTLTGVVDWPGACLGPPDFDLGWCRLDLYLLYGQQIADRFLTAYQARTVTPSADPLLADLWAVARSHDAVQTWEPNYRDLGRTDLTAPVLADRHAAWTRQLLSRLQ